MSKKLIASMLIPILACIAEGAGHADELDASSEISIAAISAAIQNQIFYRGQSFIAEHDGVLTRVELQVSGIGGDPTDVIVMLREGAHFNNPVLATTTLDLTNLSPMTNYGPNGEVPEPFEFHVADFSTTPVPLEEGQVYSIWAHSANQTTVYDWTVGTPDYPGGEALTRQNNGELQNLGYDYGFRVYVSVGAALSCQGFDSPLDAGAVTVKKNRVLPHKAQLVDADGFPPMQQLAAPPVLQVTFAPVGQTDVIDVSNLAETAGTATSGNQFVLGDDQLWHYNLSIRNFTAKGTYYTEMQSGDTGEYTVNPTCRATFVIQ